MTDEKVKEVIDLTLHHYHRNANKKIQKALELFGKVDDTYKRVFLFGTGFTGELTAKTLQEHLDALELMDQIDDVIWNFEDELESYEK